ncbi:MAG TPA: type VI secretion system tip protein VgrG [Puia sp.]|jgi:Rhs element Vgr protein
MPAETLLPSSAVSPTTDVVGYEVRVDGTAIAGTFKVLALTVREAINKIPSAQITLVDGSASDMNFEGSDTGQFKAGRKIEILIGYRSQLEKIFTGIIISNTHKVNTRGCEMFVECRDERIKMTITKSGKNYTQITDADVINQLLQTYGLSDAERTDNSAGVTHEQLVQWDVTDWDFMISRVDASDEISFIHNGAMTIKKPDWSEAVKLTLTHGLNMLEFNAEVDSRIQTQDVETISWDYTDQKIRKTTGNDPDGSGEKKDPEDDSSHSVKEVIDDIAKVLDKPFLIRAAYLDEDAQQKITDSKKMRQTLDSVRGKVKYFGSVSVLPTDFIELKGVGNLFNGKAFVSAIQHDYADGSWTTEASLGLDDRFFAEHTNPHHPASASAQVSNVKGLHTGIVTEITDDTGQYRVKIRLPLVDENDDGVYARVATLDAGNNRGTFYRPEQNDEVLVGFMNGDPRNPVILGMLHSSEMAAPLEPQSSNDLKGFVSRSGIKMLYDDGKKKFSLETPGNRLIELDDDAGKITIQDPYGNKIVMEQSGITIEAAQDMNLKAGKSISMSAPSISIKADATMEVEGAKTTVKSSAITEISGSMVKIN